MPDLKIQDVQVIAENDYGYRFCVGYAGGRWIGFATGSEINQKARQAFASVGLPVDPGFMFWLSEVSEGFDLGVRDKELAIRMTSAVAQDPESAYGGVDRWFVDETLRAGPEDFRCQECWRLGCDGIECVMADVGGEDGP